MENLFPPSTDETFQSLFAEELPVIELIPDPISTENNLFQSSTDDTFESLFAGELPITGLIPAPISTENQVELISGGATSHIQEQDLAAIGGYNSFNEPPNENSTMLQGLGIEKGYNTSTQVLEQNTTGNNTLSVINHQPSNHSSLIQTYPVEERSIIGMGIPNGQNMTTERSTLSPLQNDHPVNSPNQWNSGWPQHNQFYVVDVNDDQQYNSLYMQYTQMYNQHNNFQSQVAVPNGYGQQVVGSVQLSRHEQTMGIQTHQVLPFNANRATTQFDQAKFVLESSSIMEPPSNSILNIGNQNATPMVLSAGPANIIIPQQNQRSNLQFGRELRREEPNVAARNFIVNEVPQQQPWGNRQLQIGEGSSSKRLKINSPPRGLAGTVPAFQQQPNNAPANLGMQNQGNNGANNNAPANVGMQNQGNNGANNNAPANVGMQNQGNNGANNNGQNSRNSLYDPSYEKLGLAVDPHLRLFLASKEAKEKGYCL